MKTSVGLAQSGAENEGVAGAAQNMERGVSFPMGKALGRCYFIILGSQNAYFGAISGPSEECTI